MKNSGVLFANDVSEPRCKSLNANLQRLGVTNCIVTNYDGSGYDKVMKNFDRVLLDAPCTGTGIISRDKSIKLNKQREDVQRHGQLQRRLLLSAIDCCKIGGIVVYSTCSFMVEEDEAVVDFALGQRDVVVEDMGLPFGKPGFVKFRHHRFHASLEHARRYFPHVHNMDGFFVCRIRKVSDTRPAAAPPKPTQATDGRAERRKSVAAVAKGEKKTVEPVTASSLKISVPPKVPRRPGNKNPAGGKAAKKARSSRPKKSKQAK
jgi:ribosomal RNA methyltransferase Nop2